MDSDLAHSVYSSNSSGQFRTEQTGVGSLESDSANGRQPEVDCRWRILLLFEIDSVPQNYGAVEGEPRLRTVPLDEVGDRAVISTLTAS